MTRIRPDFTPPSSNNSGPFAYGQEINVTTAVVAQGVWWYQPATGDVADVDAFMWDPAQAQLATGALLAASITQGAWNLVPFDTPEPLPVANGYRYSAEASGQAGFDAGDQGYPINSPDNTVVAVQGCFQGGGGYPSSTWSGQHGVDLEYTAGGEPAAAALTAAGTLTAAARTIARGSASVQAAGTLTVTGRGVARAQVSMTAVALMTVLGRLVPRAAAQLAASGLLTVTLPGAVVEPGTLTPGGTSPTLTPGGSSPATLTPGGTSPSLTAS